MSVAVARIDYSRTVILPPFNLSGLLSGYGLALVSSLFAGPDGLCIGFAGSRPKAHSAAAAHTVPEPRSRSQRPPAFAGRFLLF